MSHTKKEEAPFNIAQKQKFPNHSFNPENSPYMKRRTSDYSGNIHLMNLNSSYSFKPITSSIFQQNFPFAAHYTSPLQIPNQNSSEQKNIQQMHSNKGEIDKKPEQKIKSISQKQDALKKMKNINNDKKDYSMSSRQFASKLGAGRFLRTQYDTQQSRKLQKNQIPIKETPNDKDSQTIADLKKQIDKLKTDAEKDKILGNSHAYQQLANQFIELTKKCNNLEDLLSEKDKQIEKLQKSNQSNDAQELKYTKLLLKEFKFKCEDYEQELKKLQLKCEELETSNAKYKSKAIEDEKQKQKLKIDLSKKQLISQNVKNESKNSKLSYQELGQSFQAKINELVDENYRLKNSLTSANGKIDELTIKNKSFQDMLTAFQERDKLTSEQSMFQKQLDDLAAKLQAEKDDKDRIISEYELTIMKIQNFKDHQHFSKFGSLIDQGKKERILQNMKNLINEVEDLKAKIKERDQIIKSHNQRKKH